MVFLGQELIGEYEARIKSEDDHFFINQDIIVNAFLKNSHEQEALALINLVRIAPVYVSNTIFEIVRNRYNIQDNTY